MRDAQSPTAADFNRCHHSRFRKEHITWHVPDRGAKVKHAEAFEICEYGRQHTKEELMKLFPFVGR